MWESKSKQPPRLRVVLREHPAEVVYEGKCVAESRPCTSQLILRSWLVRGRSALGGLHKTETYLVAVE
jgi:hypothetical protein